MCTQCCWPLAHLQCSKSALSSRQRYAHSSMSQALLLFADEGSPGHKRVTANCSTYLVVGAPGSRVEDYGIIRQSKTSATLTCTTCPENKTQCPHIRQAGESLPVPSFMDLTTRMEAWFDVERGCRRLTCMSTRPVPEAVACSDFATQYQGASPVMRQSRRERES